MLGSMQNPIIEAITAKFAILSPLLDERARRLWAAVEARTIGRGGLSQVAEATRLSRATIRAGLQELAHPRSTTVPQPPMERVRRPGGGRKPLGAHDPHLVRALETLLDPVTRGDPMSLLRWTCKSAAKLAAALQTQGHVVSERTVNRLLHDLGYSLQANRGHDFPDKVLGKVIPYGVYDEATNSGWVSVGIDHDTAEFAVETVRRWWRH